MNKEIEKIKPSGIFTNYIYKAIPLAFDESMSYYETLCGILSILKTQEEVINNNADLLAELEIYVKNYFDNLDVQEEINNKLDEMVEDGTLQEIITQYLQINGVLGFNTVNDLVNATNIIDGSICKTLGLNSYNDGKGEFYKIRTITSGDIVDGINIIALNISNTLIAEKIPNYYINEINEKIDDGITLMIGDSYAEGHTVIDDEITYITGWCDVLKNLLELNSTNYIKLARGACGFIGYNNTGNTLLKLVQDNIQSITNKEKVKHIIIGSGANDIQFTINDIETAIGTFFTYIKTQFVNCKDIKLFITGYHTGTGNTANNTRIGMLNVIKAYNYANNYNVGVINGSCYCLRLDGNVCSDNVHPTQAGYNAIAESMFNIIKTGNNNFNTLNNYANFDNDATVTLESDITISEDVPLYIKTLYNNNICQLFIPQKYTLIFDNPKNASNLPQNGVGFTLGTCDFKNFKNSGYITIPVNCVLGIGTGTLTYQQASAEFSINSSGVVTLRFTNGFNNVKAIAFDFSSNTYLTDLL